MKIKLKQGLAGDRFSYAPRQVIECSDKTGKSLIDGAAAEEAPAGAPVEGVLYDEAPEVRLRAGARPQPERAVKPAPETPESGQPNAVCAGKTGSGNPCKRAVVPGSRFCAKHAA